MEKAKLKIVNPRTVADLPKKYQEDELWHVRIAGNDLVIPWWGEVLVMTKDNKLKVFPNFPCRSEEHGGDWRSTDCEKFEFEGLVIADVEVAPRGIYNRDEFVMSLHIFDFKEIPND